MRGTRLFLLALAAVLALLVAGVWIVPGMLDWSRYRGSVAGLVSAAIGRPVRIGGDVTLHLLPQPILTASGIEVGEPGGPFELTAKEARLRVALGPLLGGQVDARELTLRGADLRLPWPPPPGALLQRPPSWITGLQARVEGSRVQVGSLVLDDIDASIGADPDTGTLSTAGTATLFAHSWQFTARFARPGGDGAAALDVSLDGRDKLQDTGGTFTGVVASDGALSGRVAGRGPDLSQLIPAPATAWRGDGRLTAAAGLAIADELQLEVGGSPATGAVALRVQPEARLDVALAAGRLDLDAWFPVLLHAAQPGMQPGLPTGIDLSAEAATLAGGTLRRLRGAFDLDAGGVSVRSASALLPGDASLRLSGRLPGRGKAAVFEGAARLEAPDLRATLLWLRPTAPAVIGAVPNDALHAAVLVANVAIDPALAALTNLNGTLDGTPLQGGLSLRMAPRSGVSAGLSLETLALDPWLPAPDALHDPAAAYTTLANTLTTAGFDADVKLQIHRASWQGMPMGALSIDAQTEAGRFTLRRLEATPLGMRLTASGTLAQGGRLSEARLDLSTEDLAPLQPLLPLDLPSLIRGPASLLVQAAGLPDALTLRGTLDVGDLRLEAQPVLDLGARRLAGPVTLHHPGAPRLLELAGVPGTAPWLGDGSFSLIAHAIAEPGRLELGDFTLVAGALRAGGQLALKGRVVSGRVAAETLPFPMPPPHSPAPLSVGRLARLDASVHLEAGEVLLGLTPVLHAFATDLSFNQGTLRLGNAVAKLGSGDLGGSLTAEFGRMPRVVLQAHMVRVGIAGPLWGGAPDLVSGQLDADLDVHSEGYSPAALLATLAGTADIRVRDGVAAGFDLGAASAAVGSTSPASIVGAVRTALTSGSTPFTALDLPLTAGGGVVTLGGDLAASAGTASLSGSLELLSGTLDARLVLHPAGDQPDLVTRLTGPAANPVSTPELAGLARWLAERS